MEPIIVFIAAGVVFPILLFIPAPYGRHGRPGWGPTMPAKAGWLVMELVSLVAFTVSLRGFPWLAVLWIVHYANRTFVFPLLMKGEGKRKPLLTVVMAIVFNALNGVGNGRALENRPVDLAMVAGVALFIAGFAINQHADHVLRTLRKPGDNGYSIPRGGLYRWISCPNYFGELVEWVGFAIAAQNLAAWAFAAFTFANLFPRALSHHKWYREKFSDYPAARRAIVPFVV